MQDAQELQYVLVTKYGVKSRCHRTAAGLICFPALVENVRKHLDSH